MVVRITACNNERDNVESFKITYKQSKNCTNKPLYIAHAHEDFDDLYLKIDQGYGLTGSYGTAVTMQLVMVVS